MAEAKIHCGDCVAGLAEIEEATFDSCVTDPPYHLTSIVKRFGKPGSAPAKFGTDGVFQRASTGFMGKEWDGGDVAQRVETWAAVGRVLKPGAFLLAFSGTRTYHRMVCAIEDAGFIIRDQIGWLYGSGFPKSHNLHGDWEGWGTALKPAWEPICVAQWPMSEKTVAGNVERWGTGALNIDGSRVPGIKPQVTQGVNSNPPSFNVAKERRISGDPDEGRWPANVVHDGSGEVLAEFEKYGHTRSSAATRVNRVTTQFGFGDGKPEGRLSSGFSDEGTPARFFYCAKASKAERCGSKHPTVKPLALMEWLCGLVTPPGGLILDPFLGSGSTAVAAVRRGFNCVGYDLDEESCADARNRLKILAFNQRQETRRATTIIHNPRDR